MDIIELFEEMSGTVVSMLKKLEEIPGLVILPSIPSDFEEATIASLLFALTMVVVVVSSAFVFGRIYGLATTPDPKAVKVSWVVLAVLAAGLTTPVSVIVGLVISPFILAAVLATWHWIILIASVVSMTVIISHRFRLRAQSTTQS